MNANRNYNVYIKGMNKAEKEKLFFLEHLHLDDYDTIIDFGCGSGNILKACLNNSHHVDVYGVDRDSYMLEEAIKNCNRNERLGLVNSLDKVKVKGKTLIIFSSVLHEIDVNTVNELLAFIYKYKATVVIRDMYYPNIKEEEIDKEDLAKLVKYSNPKHLSDFIKRWGMKTKEDMYHYLLKYTYIDNWKLELEENYFNPIVKHFIFNYILHKFKYTAIYDHPYTLEFKKKKVKEDFGIDLLLPTHRQMILEYRRKK